MTSVYVAGEGKGNGDGGKAGSATRMVTRLRNPDSKLSQRKVMQDKDASSQDSKALKEVRSSSFSFGTESVHYLQWTIELTRFKRLKFRNSVFNTFIIYSHFLYSKVHFRKFHTINSFLRLPCCPAWSGKT